MPVQTALGAVVGGWDVEVAFSDDEVIDDDDLFYGTLAWSLHAQRYA